MRARSIHSTERGEVTHSSYPSNTINPQPLRSYPTYPYHLASTDPRTLAMLGDIASPRRLPVPHTHPPSLVSHDFVYPTNNSLLFCNSSYRPGCPSSLVMVAYSFLGERRYAEPCTVASWCAPAGFTLGPTDKSEEAAAPQPFQGLSFAVSPLMPTNAPHQERQQKGLTLFVQHLHTERYDHGAHQ
jgi:hypothetical protein